MIRYMLSVIEWLESVRIWMHFASWNIFTDPPKQPVKRYGPHAHCMDGVVLKPSTLIHVAEKFLQMAATNNSSAGHSNTH